MGRARGTALTFLLDTNVCVRYLNGRVPSVRTRLHSVPQSEIAVCSIVKAELWQGALKSQDPVRTRANQDRFFSQFVSIPFDDAVAEVAARVRFQLVAQPIGPLDTLIAAIALANDLTLVTHNTREFGRVAGLRLDDWE